MVDEIFLFQNIFTKNRSSHENVCVGATHNNFSLIKKQLLSIYQNDVGGKDPLHYWLDFQILNQKMNNSKIPKEVLSLDHLIGKRVHVKFQGGREGELVDL